MPEVDAAQLDDQQASRRASYWLAQFAQGDSEATPGSRSLVFRTDSPSRRYIRSASRRIRHRGSAVLCDL